MSLKKLPDLCREASGGKLSPLRDLLRFLRKEKVCSSCLVRLMMDNQLSSRTGQRLTNTLQAGKDE